MLCRSSISLLNSTRSNFWRSNVSISFSLFSFFAMSAVFTNSNFRFFITNSSLLVCRSSYFLLEIKFSWLMISNFCCKSLFTFFKICFSFSKSFFSRHIFSIISSFFSFCTVIDSFINCHLWFNFSISSILVCNSSNFLMEAQFSCFMVCNFFCKSPLTFFKICFSFSIPIFSQFIFSILLSFCTVSSSFFNCKIWFSFSNSSILLFKSPNFLSNSLFMSLIV